MMATILLAAFMLMAMLGSAAVICLWIIWMQDEEGED